MRRILAVVAGTLAICAAFILASEEREAAACGIAGPYDFDTYEYPNQGVGYGPVIELAAWGRLPQLNYTITSGDLIDLRFQGLETGPRGARTSATTGQHIPPSILKSIVWNESAWTNAGSLVPYGAVGETLRSFDCGYGLGQITSGMSNPTDRASGRQALIGTHPVANMMESIRILADKWNSAPELRPIAGTGDPGQVEDWYFAIWSYNGFAFSNHPLNPARPALRGSLYHCYSPNAPAALRENWRREDYTYPELVYGCMQYPPTRRNSSTLLWQPQAVTPPPVHPFSEPAVPAVADAFAATATETVNEFPYAFVECASGGCPEMDFPTSIPDVGYLSHTDGTPDPGSGAEILGYPHLVTSGPSTAALTLPQLGDPTSVTVTVSNVGTSLAPYRIVTSERWLLARHPSDPATRSLDGGVAAGSDVPVTVGGSVQSGYVNSLIVTVDRARYPGGNRTAILWLEPLYGSGDLYRLEVNVTATYEPTEHRVVIPNASGP